MFKSVKLRYPVSEHESCYIQHKWRRPIHVIQWVCGVLHCCLRRKWSTVHVMSCLLLHKLHRNFRETTFRQLSLETVDKPKMDKIKKKRTDKALIVCSCWRISLVRGCIWPKAFVWSPSDKILCCGPICLVIQMMCLKQLCQPDCLLELELRVELYKSTAVDLNCPSRVKSVFISATVGFIWRRHFNFKSTWKLKFKSG